jgi:gamma-glutamyltranspeptidase/glutathione hydrolase
MTFYLDPPHHPNVVAPGKRPRTTLSPSLAERDGAPWTVFGTMGGDQQDQWQLQYFLNRVLFGMTPQAAIEAPKVSCEHFPGFFAPHSHFPRRVRMEPRVPEAVRAELAALGHDLAVAADWSEGFLGAVERHPDGMLEAGHDPRGAKGEIFASLALCW